MTEEKVRWGFRFEIDNNQISVFAKTNKLSLNYDSKLSDLQADVDELGMWIRAKKKVKIPVLSECNDSEDKDDRDESLKQLELM